MNTKQQLTQLIDQLNLETGLTFSIDPSAAISPENISSLQRLLGKNPANASKEDFLRQLLLGQFSSEDFSSGLPRFQLNSSALYFPALLESKQGFSATEQSILTQYFSDESSFIINIDENHIFILSRIDTSFNAEDSAAFVQDLQGFLETDAMISVYIAYDASRITLEDLPGLYTSLLKLMHTGKTLYPNKKLFYAPELSLGEIINSLSPEMCQSFIVRHFNSLSIRDFDEETLHTITVFLDTDLNIAECARKLFLHRNTLIYRLDKIEKLTGLDIRHFDDALTCKLALMISNYLNNK